MLEHPCPKKLPPRAGQRRAVTVDEAHWWARRGDESFSWSGLAAKPLRYRLGTPNAASSLKKYWQWDHQSDRHLTSHELRAAGYLEEHGGELWHIAHLPTVVNGIRTWKADLNDSKWTLLERLLDQHLASAGSDPGLATSADFAALYSAGPDNRAQFDGLVVRAAPGAASGLGACRRISIKANWLCCLGEADFGGRQFTTAAMFNHSLWLGRTLFDHSVFESIAHFQEAIFCKEATFRRCDFRDDIVFERVYADRGLSFGHCKVTKEAWLSGVVISGVLDLNRARFEEELDLRAMTILDNGKVDANYSVLEGLVDVRGARIPFDMTSYQRPFVGAVFRKPLIATQNDLHIVTLFAGATVPSGISLDDIISRQPLVDVDRLIRKARKQGVSDPCIDTMLLALEDGARVVKIALEDDNRAGRAQDYFSLQLAARSRRSTARFAERLVARTYGITSRFGQSISRPLAALFSVPFVYWPIYLLLGGPIQNLSSSMAWSALAFALHRSTFSAFTESDGGINPWVAGVEKAPTTRILIDLISTSQTLAAGTLAFLVILAIRRRLQTG